LTIFEIREILLLEEQMNLVYAQKKHRGHRHKIGGAK